MPQSKKNITLLFSFGILCMISIGLYWAAREEAHEIDPALFKLADPKSIDRVLIDTQKEKIDLQFLNGQWRVNGNFDADRNLIDVLFATVEQAIPKRNVANSIRDSITDKILKIGIHVQFLAGDTKQKEFLLLGNEGTGQVYFMNAEERKPYVMVIPGYRVYVAGIFEQDANAWRDKRIFNFNWRNFKELQAEFPREPKHNFMVAMTGRYFSIAGETNIDTTALNNYLDAVSLIRADAFYKPGETPKYDSLTQSKPILIVSVKDVADQLYTLQLFEIGKPGRNALARWGDDFVWFDRRNILQLHKRKKDFVK